MIVIVPLTGEPVEHFETYDDLFECLTTIESLKIIAKHCDVMHMDWSFTIHPPKRVSNLYDLSHDLSEALKEALAENLPFIAICAGDHKRPSYIVLTPNIDMSYLKRKWCIDWCTWHHLLVREV
jgi:hypothetical protein